MYQLEINKKYQQIHEFKSLLNRTDYIDHRQHDEPNRAMFEEIKAARINAREQINILESEIAELEAKQKEYLEAIENIEL
jgi:BMFP domain-containing protein YqiC